MRAVALLASLALAAGVAACGGDEVDGGTFTAPSGAPTEPAPTQTQADVQGCKSVEAPAPKPDGGEEAPKAPLKKGASYEAVVSTNCGDFTIKVTPKTAPKTAASFVALARKGFYDDTVFTRIVTDYVIQGGEPTWSGEGGPGYETRDVPPADAAYTKGVVAMAKSGSDPPGTAGSSFFVVTTADAGLPPEYALLGKVTDGIEVVDRIGGLGSPTPEGTPTATVVIQSMKVRES